MRLQSPQNGSDTGLMKPIDPLPSAKRYTRAVEWALRGWGSSGKCCSMIARTSAPLSTLSGVQAWSASRGMNSMKRTS